jgi:hypothetical protein
VLPVSARAHSVFTEAVCARCFSVKLSGLNQSGYATKETKTNSGRKEEIAEEDAKHQRC